MDVITLYMYRERGSRLIAYTIGAAYRLAFLLPLFAYLFIRLFMDSISVSQQIATRMRG